MNFLTGPHLSAFHKSDPRIVECGDSQNPLDQQQQAVGAGDSVNEAGSVSELVSRSQHPHKWDGVKISLLVETYMKVGRKWINPEPAGV